MIACTQWQVLRGWNSAMNEISKSSLMDTRWRWGWTTSYHRCGSGLIACLFEEQKKGAECTHQRHLILSHLLLSACQVTHSLIILIPRNKCKNLHQWMVSIQKENAYVWFNLCWVTWCNVSTELLWRYTAKCSFFVNFCSFPLGSLSLMGGVVWSNYLGDGWPQMGQRLCFPQLDADGVAIETLTNPNHFFNKT